MMLRRRGWLYLGALLFASCSFVTDSCACVRVPATMHVVGTVTVVGGGQEVVSMATSTHPRACGSSGIATFSDQGVTTVSVGAYRLSFATTEGTYCAVVTASTLSAPPHRTRRDSVTLQSSFNADSARLDLVIP